MFVGRVSLWILPGDTERCLQEESPRNDDVGINRMGNYWSESELLGKGLSVLREDAGTGIVGYAFGVATPYS